VRVIVNTNVLVRGIVNTNVLVRVIVNTNVLVRVIVNTNVLVRGIVNTNVLVRVVVNTKVPNVIRSRISKMYRQYNGQRQKDKHHTNKRSSNTNPTKTWA
jgi:hypothetical protein